MYHAENNGMIHIYCCICRLVPPDDEQFTCLKHAEVNRQIN